MTVLPERLRRTRVREEGSDLEENAHLELTEYVRVLRRHWALISAVALTATAAATVASLLQAPTYQAIAKVYVSTTSPSVQDLSQGNSYLQQVVKSYADVATTPYVLDPVIKQLHLHTTPALLAQSVTASAPVDTVIVEIDARNHDPGRAAQIADGVSTSLIQVVGKLVPQTGSASPVKITQVQSATVPAEPTSPNVPLYIGVGFLLGLALGVGLAVLRETLDTRVRSESDVSGVTSAPILGRIALDARATSRPLIVQIDARDRRAESFRSLRTNLQFLDFKEQVRSIVLTSAIEGEGKSTSVANLAIALADAGERVVVVEADLRRPKVADYFGLEGSVGLTDVLIGRERLGAALQTWGRSNMAVLPAGQVPPNPSELLGSAAMARVLQSLGEEFTTILIDAPPLLPVTDAAVLSKLASGAIVICAAGRSRRPQLSAALAALDAVGARVLGVVLTMVPTRGPDSYGYGTYGYSGAYEYSVS